MGLVNSKRRPMPVVRASAQPDKCRTREPQLMKHHYDFSKGTRGKFYQADAVFRLPVYLDEAVEQELAAKAEA